MKNKTIEYYTEKVYGTEKFYVADKKIANIITLINGRKTLLSHDFEGLKELGFDFKEVLKPR